MNIKVVAAEKGIGMTREEALDFLKKSKSMIRLGTIDASREPNIHPTWYHFEPKSMKLYLFTWAKSKKAGNVRRHPGVYFDVDDDRPPYKGVRGKAKARILKRGDENVAITKKIVGKYVPLSKPSAQSFVKSVESGESVVVELSPLYLSTWDYSKEG